MLVNIKDFSGSNGSLLWLYNDEEDRLTLLPNQSIPESLKHTQGIRVTEQGEFVIDDALSFLKQHRGFTFLFEQDLPHPLKPSVTKVSTHSLFQPGRSIAKSSSSDTEVFGLKLDQIIPHTEREDGTWRATMVYEKALNEKHDEHVSLNKSQNNFIISERTLALQWEHAINAKLYTIKAKQISQLRILFDTLLHPLCINIIPHILHKQLRIFFKKSIYEIMNNDSFYSKASSKNTIEKAIKNHATAAIKPLRFLTALHINSEELINDEKLQADLNVLKKVCLQERDKISPIIDTILELTAGAIEEFYYNQLERQKFTESLASPPSSKEIHSCRVLVHNILRVHFNLKETRAKNSAHNIVNKLIPQITRSYGTVDEKGHFIMRHNIDNIKGQSDFYLRKEWNDEIDKSIRGIDKNISRHDLENTICDFILSYIEASLEPNPKEQKEAENEASTSLRYG